MIIFSAIQTSGFSLGGTYICKIYTELARSTATGSPINFHTVAVLSSDTLVGFDIFLVAFMMRIRLSVRAHKLFVGRVL